MAAGRLRGSEVLAQRYTEDDLVQLIELDHEGVELVEVFPRGIPAPDGGWGTWHVHPDALGKLIAELLKQRHVPHVWVFPKGIPYPERFEVGFRVGSAARR